MNDIVKNDGSIPPLPAHFQGEQPNTAMMAGLKKGLPDSFPSISIMGGKFATRINGIDRVMNTQALEVIVVGNSDGNTKSYYKGAFDPNEKGKSPDCWSDDGLYPNSDVPTPEHDGPCATCPHNEYGSGVNDKGEATGGKACGDRKILMVVSAKEPGGLIYRLSVPPTAFKSLSMLISQLEGRASLNWIITTLSFNPEQRAYPELQFAYGGMIDAEQKQIVDAIMESGRGAVPTSTGKPVAPTTPRPPSQASQETPAEAPKEDTAKNPVAPKTATAEAPETPTPNGEGVTEVESVKDFGKFAEGVVADAGVNVPVEQGQDNGGQEGSLEDDEIPF